MPSTVFTARQTPVSAAVLNTLVAGDGQANTGNLALGGATGLFWDDSTKRLGRGTQAPTVALDWLDASAALAASWATNGDADVVHWLVGDADNDGAGTRAAFVGLDYSADVLKIGRGSDFDAPDTVVTLDGSGNVGIGTAAPTRTLEIERANDDGPILALGNSTTTTFEFSRSSSTGALLVQGTQVGSRNICLAPSGGSIGIGTATPGGVMELNMAGADVIFADASEGGGTGQAQLAIYIGGNLYYLRAYTAA